MGRIGKLVSASGVISHFSLIACLRLHKFSIMPTVANHCGRSSNQCINRWSKTLRPDIKKGKWDPCEDEALKNAVAACGMVWKDVAPRVRGRTDAQCRERWCNILDPRIVVGNWTPEVSNDCLFFLIAPIHQACQYILGSNADPYIERVGRRQDCEAEE